MKKVKTIEQLLAVPASSWSYADLETIAHAIKDCPANNELKNHFLNLDPRTGDYCNRILYSILSNIYCWLLKKYNIFYTLDEYIESVSYYIYIRSFIDWMPGISLSKYLKRSSLPHGPIGKDIKRNYYLIDAVRIDELSEENDSLLSTESLVTTNQYNTEVDEFIGDILKIVKLSSLEIRLLTDLANNQRMTTEYIAYLNQSFGTNYAMDELSAIRDKANHRIKYRKKELQELLKKYR